MRQELEQRQLLLLSVAFLIGLVTPGTILVALFLLPFVLLKSPSLRVWCAALFFLGLGLSPYPQLENLQPLKEEMPFHEVVHVVSVPSITDQGVTAEAEWQGHEFLLIAPEQPVISLGDRVQVEGYLAPLPETTRQLWLRRGVTARLIARFEPEVRQEGPLIFRTGAHWLRSFREFTRRTLDPAAAQLVDALCFNVDTALDYDMREDLTRSGTIHIVSASGLHVMIFALALQLLFSLLPVPRWVQVAMLIAVLCIYAGAAGFRPPVVRAVLMAALYVSAYLFKREADLLTALGFSSLVYLLWKPDGVLDIGFQLSFVTVAALALFLRTDTLQTWPAIPRRLAQGAHASLIATLASAPLLAYYFGSFSVVAVLANVLIGIVVAPIVVGSLLAWGISFALPAVAQGVMMLITPLTEYLSGVVSWVGGWAFAAVDVPPFSPWLIPVYYAVFLALWRPRPRRVPPPQTL